MDTESKTYDEAEFQRLYDQLLGYLGKDCLLYTSRCV